MRPDSPEGASQSGGRPGGMLPRNILKLKVAKDAISCILGGRSFTENELFMIIKLDVASSTGSPF